VVVVSGLGATSTMWSQVLPGFQAVSRTCVYDRPGLGRSPARVGPQRIDAGTHARELRALLRAVGEPGPYLLVGHSYGGLVVRAFARAYPATVAAVLLVEGVYPGIQVDYWAPYRHDWHEGSTVIDMAASARADGDGPRLGVRPLVVITAADPEPGAPQWVVALWNLRQRQAAALSSDSVHVVALDSGHVVQQDQPAVVIEAVRELAAAVRTGAELPRCDKAWAAIGARCA
jgi:pimeloyl-ACP methyl ester carboxylesterase